MKELEYLMAPLVECAKKTKEKKKAVRQENIEKGSRLHPSLDMCKVWISG